MTNRRSERFQRGNLWADRTDGKFKLFVNFRERLSVMNVGQEVRQTGRLDRLRRGAPNRDERRTPIPPHFAASLIRPAGKTQTLVITLTKVERK